MVYELDNIGQVSKNVLRHNLGKCRPVGFKTSPDGDGRNVCRGNKWKHPKKKQFGQDVIILPVLKQKVGLCIPCSSCSLFKQLLYVVRRGTLCSNVKVASVAKSLLM